MKIDTEQHLKQLQILGYSEGEKVFYRLINGKGFEKTTAQKRERTFPNVPQSHNETMGVYFVVNGQGQTDDKIQTCRAFFAEWDDRPLAEQETLWKEKGFLQPSFMVKTRKSIHCYWVLSEPIPVEDWKIIQANLLNFLDADRSLKNPSRVLRVAGAWHVKADAAPIQCELINVTGEKFTQAQIEAAITVPEPEIKIPPAPVLKTDPGIIPPVPLASCLPQRDRKLITNGAGEGSRNQTGYGLAKNLIATEQYLRSEGISFSDSAYDLFLEYCLNCDSTDWVEREWKQIWESAKKSAPANPPLDPDKIDNCLKKWARDNGSKYQVKTSTPLKTPSTYEDDDDGESVPGQGGKGKSYDDPALSWKEKAFLDCFSDGEYISFGDDKKLALYKFNGQYYEKFPRSQAEELLIAWAYQNPVKTKGGKWVAAHLSPDAINGAYEWALKRKRVNDDLINPPGINLSNGRLVIEWDGATPNPTIKPHTSKVFYTYCSPIKYNPQAKTEYCDKLLSCISNQEQTIFLRSVALAFDLENFRRFTGRPRALFLEGVGENGKDSLRLVVEQIFGQFMVDTALNNFYQFEQGQIGGLADLDGALVSWASENSDQYKVEKLKSLFRLISGEQVKINPKGRDERTIKPNAVFFFNVNEAPRMDGSLNAMKSRFCVIRFQKSFKMHPNPDDSQEMQADPRFKYDPQWVEENVSPAFLNRVLAEVPHIAAEGVPYGNLDHYFQEIRKKSNHLWEFVEEVGMVEANDGKIYISDLWLILREWYEANGTLEVIQPETDKGRPKLIWHEQLKRFDRPIKGANQIYDAFSNLFPKITKQRETAKNSRTGSFYLAGLKLAETASTASTSHEMGVIASTSSSTSFNSLQQKEEEGKGEVRQLEMVEAVVEAKVEAVDNSEACQGKGLKQLKQLGGGYAPPEENGKLTREEAEHFKGMVTDFKEVLGWDSAKMTDYAKETVGKSTIGRLTMAEAVLLVESLGKLVEALDAN